MCTCTLQCVEFTCKMQEDPWTRKKTVMAIAIADIALAIFLVFYAGVRLLKYDYADQSIIYLISEEENTLFSVLYWLLVFALLSVQLVIAFFLLTAANDMTTDPETMMNKCLWWRTLSSVFLVMLAFDLIVLLCEFYTQEDAQLKVFRLTIDILEILFRLYGVYFIGRFIRDLHSLFDSPMVIYGYPPSPAPIVRGTLNPLRV